jgi:hypothetical protein
MNILLSYPRSGNHLVRFFIELLTETPTLGCIGNEDLDKPIYKTKFITNIPFNIKNNINYNNTECFTKFHFIDNVNNYNYKNNLLIFIIRNPKEVLLRHDKFVYNEQSFNKYFEGIDYYLYYKGHKLLLYYEDIITNKKEFIYELYDFLKKYYYVNNDKLEYIINNINELYHYSANPINRNWGKVNSNFNAEFYYKKIENSNNNKHIELKHKFDNYLKIKLQNNNYNFIVQKYNL